MSRIARWSLLLGSLVPIVVAYGAALGLGLHRHGSPLAISAAATVLMFLPPVALSMVARRERAAVFAASAAIWAAVGLLMMPVYFPGERRDAVTTGLALFFGGQGQGVADSIASSLPDEQALAEPELALAREVVEPPLPPGREIAAHEIVLPYEGEGRNLAIPVVFGNAGNELELSMMLDTGATYTTLDTETLNRLGIELADDDPVITLQTANGQRQAHIVIVDQVWLGDLLVEGVAIATCDACSARATAGLLGLNVAGGFNTTIDADRREVIFSRRREFDRRLDAKPFLALNASFARYPGGRVEVTVELANDGPRDILSSTAEVSCGERSWHVDLGPVDVDEVRVEKRKLPRHEACEAYRIQLDRAIW